MQEIWKDIPDYEGYYQVSNLGNVKSLRKNRLLTPIITFEGYCAVSLKVNGKEKRIFIHRLVAMAFLSNPNRYPQVNHINAIKSDNSLSNLEWCTGKQNMNHAFNKGLVRRYKGVDNPMNKLSKEQVLQIVALKGIKSAKNIGKDFGVSDATVLQIFKGKKWSHVTGIK